MPVGPEAGIEPRGDPSAEPLHRRLQQVIGARAARQQHGEEHCGRPHLQPDRLTEAGGERELVVRIEDKRVQQVDRDQSLTMR